MARISVIIPVYNAADTLPRCLDSVFAQTQAPYEIIAVNDGSTDDSLLLLNTYARQHSHLQIITQDNSGVSTARNIGIEAATGDWMLFLDTDDYLAPNTVETLAQDIRGELSLAGLTIHTCEKTYPQNLYQKNANNSAEGLLNIEDALSLLSYYTFCGPVCKLFRSDLIKRNDIRFPSDMHFGEDTIFVYNYLKFVTQITVHNVHPYHCDKSNPSSLTATVNSVSCVASIRRIYPVMREVFQAHHLPLQHVDYIYLDALQTATHLSYKDHGLRAKERINIYQEMFANENFDTLKSQCSPIFLALCRMHTWHLCDLYLNFRTIQERQ